MAKIQTNTGTLGAAVFCPYLCHLAAKWTSFGVRWSIHLWKRISSSIPDPKFDWTEYVSALECRFQYRQISNWSEWLCPTSSWYFFDPSIVRQNWWFCLASSLIWRNYWILQYFVVSGTIWASLILERLFLPLLSRNDPGFLCNAKKIGDLADIWKKIW